MNLPLCKHRGPQRPEDGLYPCASQWLIVFGPGVSEEICLKCPYADRDNPTGPLAQPRAPREFNCVHLGSILRGLDGRAKTIDCPTCGGQFSRQVVHACDHEEHGPETWVKRCSQCPGYNAPTI